MKMFLMRLTLAVAIVFVAGIAAPPAYAQQTEQNSAPTAPRKSDAAAVPAQHANEGQMPASGETTTQAAKSFNGNIVKENGAIVLQDPVTKVTYKLDDAAKAKQYLGKRVKVTGKLDMNSNTILMENIEPAS
jgi:predicted lipid-binding transport protein (Tim44 family)